MGKAIKPVLKGIDDFGDPKYSMRAIVNRENGKLGGEEHTLEHLSLAGKQGAIINVASGQVFDAIKKAWKRRDELIESGEWSEMAAKGGDSTAANWDGQLDHMRSINEEGRKASAKSRKKKALSKNQKRLNELSLLLEKDKWYTAEEIVKLYPDFQSKSGTKTFRRFALKNTDFFEVEYNCHQTKSYKKI